MKRLAIPLASYVAVTVLVPILNGAPIDAAFLEHALLAIALPLVIAPLIVWLLSRTIWTSRRLHRAKELRCQPGRTTR